MCIYLNVIQDAQINFEEGRFKEVGYLKKMNLPKYPHCAIICGQTGCGKTEFVLELLEAEYIGVFEHIVIFCPTIQCNKAYKGRPWICDVRKPKTKNMIIVNPVFNGEEKLRTIEIVFSINMLVHLLYISFMIVAPQKN